MHWLQTLDTNLFLFVNRSLVNPFFDWLMPVLSGDNGMKNEFILLAVAAGLALLWFGNRRARLCVLLMILIVATNDGLLCNTLKHAVARPRPFATLPEARVSGTVGNGYVPPEINQYGVDMAANQGSRNSMPSSHAANWFAATMVAFLFYRRSLWFMLPMALGVSFSRVYNGVHYPGDVLAGAILGAGYAAAAVIGLQTAWNWIGKKWFPLWHAQLPSLLNAERGVRSAESEIQTPNSNFQNATHSALRTQNSELEWLRLGCILIFAMLIGRWIYLASGAIELSQDEAYQWIWSKHPALSYYSKPPAIAFIQLAGTSIFGDTEFGVRFFSPLLAAITSLLLLRFLAREIGARPSFWLLVAATATPLLGIGTILMTVDPPLVLCWTWALVAGWRAAQPDGKTRDWLVVGLAMGLGFLCKYTAVMQIACWAVFFALAPATRIHLQKSGPWLALLIFSLCTLPVVIWNSQHGWSTFNDVGGDAGLHSQWHPTLRYFWDFLFTQFGVLNPIFFVGAIWAMFGFWKLRHERPLWLYFFCMGTPVFLGYLLWSFHSGILPNWIAPSVLPMFCLMVVYWHEHRRVVKPFFAAGVALGIFTIAVMYQSNLIARLAGQPLPGEKDPSRRVRAWTVAATLVEDAREKLAAEGSPAFIIAGHYGITGLYSFYIPQARAALKSGPLVYCADSDEPENQFHFWPEYNYRDQRKGQNAIFAAEAGLYKLEDGWVWKWLAHQPVNHAGTPTPAPLPSRIAQEFESVTDLGEQDIKIGDRVFHRVHLWACYNLK
jgi:4-amino-4-deoxy-L-arabinose transferase-like glycosyltransferase/membrane-associated phospholipid phosphatase